MPGPEGDEQNTDFDIYNASGPAWQSDPPAKHPSSPPLSAAPYYLPNLILALVASVGIIVGSIGPWLHLLMVNSINGLGVNGWTLVTLILGALSGIALFTQLNWGRTTFSLRWAVPMAWAVLVAGVGCLAIAVVFIVRIFGASNDLFGTTIAVQVDWGLWMVAISSAVLCVTSAVVAVQIGKANEDNSRPSQAAWAGAWRWAAIIASAVILLYALVKASFSPITVNNNAAGNQESTATVTATNTMTVPVPAPSARPTPPLGPTPETIPTNSTPCQGNFVNSEFPTSAIGNDNTSCPFADAVADRYVRQPLRATTVTLQDVLSPTNRLAYTMTCTGNRVVTCTGGNGAVVYLY